MQNFILNKYLVYQFLKSFFNVILIFIAGLISYSRIYIGVHYPLDIICGMLAGSIIGILFYRIWEKTKYSSEY